MIRILGGVAVAAMLMACGRTTPVAPLSAPPQAAVPEPVVAPPEPPTPREQTLRALRLFDQKQWGEAVNELAAAAVLNPRIAPFLRLRIVAAHDAWGDHRAATEAANALIALHPDSAAATFARLRLPGLHARLGDTATTDLAFREAMRIPLDELTEEHFVSLANALAAGGRADLATEVRMRLLADYTSGRFTEQTYGKLDSVMDTLPLDQSITLAQKLARADRYDQALDLLGRIAKRFPDAQTAELYRATRLRALFNSRNYGQLLAEAAGVPLNDPALVLLRARAAWRDDKPQEFLDGLSQLEKQHPQSKEALEAKVLRAKYYVTDEIDYDRALADLQAAIDGGAVGNDGENLWTLGWVQTLQGKTDAALATFARYIRTYPDGDYKTNSLFWTAKILDRLGRTAERDASAAQIVAEYPFSYYAYRVKELWNVKPAPTQPAIFPDVDAQLATVDATRLATIRDLQDVGLHRDATREAKLLAAAYPDNLGAAYLLADVYVQGGEPFKANGILQRRFRQFVRHGGENIPPRFWQILFPLAYFETIQNEAARRNLDPYLVASIIRQESGFEPTTVSNAGAVGLMQIMPEEASRIGDAAGIAGMTRERLFDPQTNIAVGAAEYSQKLSAVGGNHPLAIAAYNAGETAVARWLSRTPVDDIDRFIESIPYAETRLYVKIVTRNQAEYRRIYGSPAADTASK